MRNLLPLGGVVFALALLCLLAGCSGGLAPSPVSITTAPPTLTFGDQLTFQATVSGARNTQVIWSVQEPNGGTIDPATGQYTAPQTAGVYHVTAASVAYRPVSATVAVTVQSTPGTVNVQ